MGWESFKIKKVGGCPSFHSQSPPAPPFPHVRNLATTRFLGTTRLRYFIRSPSIQVVTSIPDCLLFGSSVNTHAVEHWARAYGFEGVRNFIGVPVFIEPARGPEKLTPRIDDLKLTRFRLGSTEIDAKPRDRQICDFHRKSKIGSGPMVLLKVKSFSGVPVFDEPAPRAGGGFRR